MRFAQLGSNQFWPRGRIIWGCGQGRAYSSQRRGPWMGKTLQSMAFTEVMNTLPWWSCWAHLSRDMTCPSLEKHCGTGKGRGGWTEKSWSYFYIVEYWDNGNILKIWWKCFFLYGTNLLCWKLSCLPFSRENVTKAIVYWAKVEVSIWVWLTICRFWSDLDKSPESGPSWEKAQLLRA